MGIPELPSVISRAKGGSIWAQLQVIEVGVIYGGVQIYYRQIFGHTKRVKVSFDPPPKYKCHYSYPGMSLDSNQNYSEVSPIPIKVMFRIRKTSNPFILTFGGSPVIEMDIVLASEISRILPLPVR